ncbi:citrate lyase beta subunit [Rhizobium sp. SG_E_25_P2]|uniref:aldolase/citrate lyase family protein n=1 Tax=Rhizobium sp. SG_E_25_P2 TaxID=2879942 RepID=UPI0024740A55|nr:aldolase/citrate lyase family protein [Rhizobium sp. SG_E_25_P2]MDH6267960.1 citrate lyase beta subunit [Rhizobium sp. SG_E_25_P2]
MSADSDPATALSRLHWFQTDRQDLVLAVVNGESEHLAVDLQTVLAAPNDGLLIRRCDGLAGIERVETALRVAEARLGVVEGETPVVASMADTARAVLALRKPMIASPRLIGLTWDRPALRKSLGCSDPSPLLDQAGLQLLYAAAAAGCAAFDWQADTNPELEEKARSLGFAGACIG